MAPSLVLFVGLSLPLAAGAESSDASSPIAVMPSPTVLPATPMSPDAPSNNPRAIQKLLAEGKNEEALAAANQYLQMSPHDGAIQFVKAQALTRLGRVDEAITVLEALVESSPEMAAPYNNLAVLYASKGRLEDARKELEMVLLVQPNYATAHENLGDLYVIMARQAYDRALKLDPNNKALKAKAAKLN
jgi:Flp pilus assembly protein TadD